MKNTLQKYLIGLCFALSAPMIFPAHAETQIVVVTGVVTSGNAAERLANESVGLYADKKRTTGELARDVSLGPTRNRALRKQEPALGASTA